MSKKVFIIAMLIIGMMAGVSSCKKKTVEPTEPETTDTIQAVEYVEPVDDVVNVTTDVEALVYLKGYSEGSYKSCLVKRLNNVVSTYKEETTKMIVVSPDDIDGLTFDDLRNIFKCWNNGGCIVFVEPKIQHGKEFREKMLTAGYAIKIANAGIQGIGEQEWRELPSVKAMFNLLEHADEINDKHYRCVGFCKRCNYTFNDDYSDSLVHNATPYQYGKAAESCIRWINDAQEYKKDYGFTKGLKQINSSIEEGIPWKKIEDFGTYLYRANHDSDHTYTRYCSDYLHNEVTVYIAHDKYNNLDYYDVEQSCTYKNAMYDPVPNYSNHQSWWCGYLQSKKGEDGTKGKTDALYINAQNNGWPVIELTSNHGTVAVSKSHPESVDYTGDEGVHTPSGILTSIAGKVIGGYTGNVLMHANSTMSAITAASMIVSNGMSITTGKSECADRLYITKNTSGSRVAWSYYFKDPWLKLEGLHLAWRAPSHSITDNTETNSVLFTVSNPSGPAHMYFYHHWGIRLSWVNEWSTKMNNNNKDRYESEYNWTVELPEPLRFTEPWVISTIDYGDITGDYDQMDRFNRYVTQKIMGVQQWSFELGGVDENDTSNAIDALNVFVNLLNTCKTDMENNGFTGDLEFQIQGATTGHVITVNWSNPAKGEKIQ